MHRALDLRVGMGDDSDGTSADRRFDEILSVELRAPEGTENIAGRELAVINGKAGDALITGITVEARDKIIQSHGFALRTRLLVSTAAVSTPTHRRRDVRRE